jgi:hypothetical protein
MDTVPAVQGRHVDIYCGLQRGAHLAKARHRRQPAAAGWNPKVTAPTLLSGCSTSGRRCGLKRRRCCARPIEIN